ncbi:putative lipid-binding transport protein (Tim44 family) [Collimonas sp. PA-H2]|uniref:Tim44 domain-containing protein n=1 Tax=Collimonas sp. PA-H2 TaxID=1881062 RepID=UPI000BF6E7D5|nr:Tim44-like domain-containing protein [Collimonas sp. PA-H2]PFH10486.1 putative lipid-binding transport protein (Tim44 family) [Collimonas sp. PA-H2]
MKKFLLMLLMVATTLSMTISNADARRLGGGGSFGKQSSGISRQAPSAPSQNFGNANQAKPAAPAATPSAVPPKPASPWKGILGGALLGLGLGALMSHFGMGGAFGSFLMIALLAVAVIFVVRLVMRKNSPAPAAYSGPGSAPNLGGNLPAANFDSNSSSFTPEIGSRVNSASSFQSSAAPAAAANSAPWGIPADFDVPGFVRSAKTYFIRLQAAWDKADINDIREFTTPEMFGELRLQLQERGASPNNTDVVQLDGELMGIETVGNDYLASVKFTGLIKEVPEASAEPFTEVWNMSKPLSGQGGWVLAGIQQVAA